MARGAGARHRRRRPHPGAARRRPAGRPGGWCWRPCSAARRGRPGGARRAARRAAGLVALGLLFGLVGGLVLGTVAVADRTVTAYARLAAATGLADAQVLLPAAHATVFDQVPTMPGVTALDAGRLDRADQHPGRPVRLAQRRPRPPAGARRARRRRGPRSARRRGERDPRERAVRRGPGSARRRRGDPAPPAGPGRSPGSPKGSAQPDGGFARVRWSASPAPRPGPVR